jgi:hypothetical protein
MSRDSRLPGRTLLTLASVADDDLGEELRLIWEVEPGREIVAATATASRRFGQVGRDEGALALRPAPS